MREILRKYPKCEFGIRNHPLIYKDVEVYGFVMDPHTGAMREVK